MMSEMNKYHPQHACLKQDTLSDFSNLIKPELDYEYEESLSESKSSVTNAVVHDSLPQNSQKEVKHAQPLLQKTRTLKQTTARIGSKFFFEEEAKRKVNADFHVNQFDFETIVTDVLDLHRMAEKFANSKIDRMKRTAKIVYASGDFNYEVVSRVDKLLEEAYTICHMYQNKLDQMTREKLLNLILELNELPHLYLSTHREKKRNAHVSEWLNKYTEKPEPELCGFSEQDPFQLRKFVSDTLPRKSSSDTNITLGKRTRGLEECVNNNIHKSSSDSSVYVHADCERTRRCKKRRRIND